MREYLIRTVGVGAHDLPGIVRGRETAVLVPADSAACVSMAWRNSRCDVMGPVDDHPEFPGWQVTIDGPMPENDCERLVAALGFLWHGMDDLGDIEVAARSLAGCTR
jgi:hypothetical protein